MITLNLTVRTTCDNEGEAHQRLGYALAILEGLSFIQKIEIQTNGETHDTRDNDQA